MRHTNSFLCECAKLRERGLPCEFEIGRVVARGYADLGYEEFLLLGERKLLSLLSGKVSALPEEHAPFFFAVPTADRMIQELAARGFDIAPLCFEAQRTWRASAVHGASGRECLAQGDTLEAALLRLLGEALKSA